MNNLRLFEILRRTTSTVSPFQILGRATSSISSIQNTDSKEVKDPILSDPSAATIPGTKTSLRLPPLPSPRELLKLYRIKAQRTLSQNFLLDFRLNNKIVSSTGSVKDCYVCEVGPGPGNITRAILQNGAKHVIVVEKDRRFLPALELLADASEGRLKIILGDIMDLTLENILPKDLAKEWQLHPPPLYIIGNLPFNISTPLIIKWLRYCSLRKGPFVHGRTRLSLTFQKEVADRMVAPAGVKCRCRLSVICQCFCHVDNLFTIPGRAFFPKPEVDVSVVRFTPRIRPLIDQPFDVINKLISTIFQHRQKFTLYGIKNLFPEENTNLVDELVQRSKINPEKKCYELEIEEFKALCDVYSEMCERHKNLLNYTHQIHKKRDYSLDADFTDELSNK